MSLTLGNPMMWVELIPLSSQVWSHTRGPTCIPAWVLRCWVPSRLLGASAGGGSSVCWGLRVLASLWAFPPLLSPVVVVLIKHQLHPRHGLPEDAGGATGRRRRRLLDKEKAKWSNVHVWVLFLFASWQSWCSPGRAGAAEWRTDRLHRGRRSSAGCWVSRSGNGYDGRGKTHPPVHRASGDRGHTLQMSVKPLYI